MCGIFGVVDVDSIDGGRFVRALNTLEKRGPDDAGLALFGAGGARVASVDAPQTAERKCSSAILAVVGTSLSDTGACRSSTCHLPVTSR